MIKYLILDFGKVLAYPTTGDWFITPLFLELIDMSKLNRDDILKAMNNHGDILSRKIYTFYREFYLVFCIFSREFL